MPKRIYVGNLPFSSNKNQLLELLRPAGKVRIVDLEKDRATVELESEAAAEKAMQILSRARLGGNSLRVQEIPDWVNRGREG